MILTKEIKINKTSNLSSEYIESKLKELGLTVLRWAIVGIESENYLVNAAVIDNS